MQGVSGLLGELEPGCLHPEPVVGSATDLRPLWERRVHAIGRGDMSTSSIRKGRRKRWALVGLLAACVGVFLSVGAGSASAAVSCTFSTAGQLTVGINSSFPPTGNDIVVVRQRAESRSWSGSTGRLPLRASVQEGSRRPSTPSRSTCIPAAVEISRNGNDTLTIDQRAGRFAPGLAPEALIPSRPAGDRVVRRSRCG